MSQYIGKTISLVSVTDNRYVGLLEDIDSEKGTVTLREVRCFGTEGRKNWGPEEIYPNPTVYNSVKFNGSEVKDLSILDANINDIQPVVPQMMPPASQPSPSQQDQSPRQAQAQAHAQPQAQAQAQAHPQAVKPESNVPAAVAGYGVYTPSSTEATTARKDNVNPPNRDERKDGDFEQRYQRNKPTNRAPQSNRSHKVEIPNEDFDFQSNNAKFTKEDSTDLEKEQELESAAEKEDESDEAFYNKKSSFFDTISTSTETNTNMRWQEEKVLNVDTFGQASARPRFNSRGRGRGRGGNYRGNRGNRGRGGQRSGYQNRNNYQNNRGGYQNYQIDSQDRSSNHFSHPPSNVEF